MTPPGSLRDSSGAGALDWDPSDTVGEFDIETRVAAVPVHPRAGDQETRVGRTPEQETRVAPAPAERRRLARGTRSDGDTQVEPAPDVPYQQDPEGEKETRIEPPPKRARRRSAAKKDAPTMSLRGSRWSQQRPTTGVGSRSRHARGGVGPVSHEPDRTRAESAASVRARRRGQTSPGPVPETLNLPVEVLVLERMKLSPSKARITDMSRAAAFVACKLQPLAGRRLVMRVASDVGVGVAVGYVQATLDGAGFSVRINASTGGFRAYVDALRGFAESGRSPRPNLIEPISMQVL